ncbi:tetratricopeptide repeat protein [Streptomyces olivoreticuli]|uniref:tetratricopeptide repeat protein n=1 Tax=Streptomyces olivoreticuli TaxID=68246 RepID=UPI000E24F4DD|nr:tetratricopeptide repeat protein [Streptomyces olivoreticuli]
MLYSGASMQAGRDINRPTIMEAPAPVRPTVTHSLPQDIADFTGRDAELQRLLAAAAPGQVATVHTVDGMPGVGKTALVTRAAHLLAERFPDGQFFHELHAHTPGQAPAQPVDVLAVLLTDLGIDPRNLPPTLEGRSALWRDRLAGKQVLLVLDDAADHAQVRPLLPGSIGCLTLITSRRRLVALDGARPLPLAAALDGAPLAATRRRLEMLYTDHLLDETAPGRYQPHDLLRTYAHTTHNDPADDREHSAERLWDYYRHTAQTADHLLSGAPQPDAPPTAAPTLPDRASALAWMRTERANLIACLDTATTDQATRMVHLTAAMAAFLILEGPWTQAAVLHQRAATAAHHRADARAEAIALDDLGIVRVATGEYAEAARLYSRALALYEDLGDRYRQANTLNNLGIARLAAEEYEEAARLHWRALTLYEDLGSQYGQADTLDNLGNVRYMADDYAEAARLYEQALALFQDLGDCRGEANTLNSLGNVRYVADDYAEAARLYKRALALYEDLGNRYGQANALDSLGNVWQATEEYEEAAQLHEKALALFQGLGNRLGEASTRNDLGKVRQATGKHAEVAAPELDSSAQPKI